MPSGSNISDDEIADLLNYLLTYTDPPYHLGINYLLVVEDYLSRPEIPNVKEGRLLASVEIICNLIETHYTYQRQALQLRVGTIENQGEAIQAIQDDMMADAQSLILLSCLYFIFVKPELGISPELFQKTCGITARTYRRYRRQACRYIARQLFLLEAKTRHQHAQKRLQLQLPYYGVRAFSGRVEETQELINRLEARPTTNILITGMQGVGKSAFVEHVINEILSQGQFSFDYLIWVAEGDNILERVASQVNLGVSRASLSNWLTMNTVLVVIDDADDYPPDHLKTALTQLKPAQIILISSRYLSIPSFADEILLLNELEELDAIQLIKYEIERRSLTASSDLVDYVYETAGGYPAEIQRVIYDFAFGWQNTRLASKPSNAELALYWSSNGYMRLDDVMNYWNNADLTRKQIEALIQVHLIERQVIEDELWIALSNHSRRRCQDAAVPAFVYEALEDIHAENALIALMIVYNLVKRQQSVPPDVMARLTAFEVVLRHHTHWIIFLDQIVHSETAIAQTQPLIHARIDALAENYRLQEARQLLVTRRDSMTELEVMYHTAHIAYRVGQYQTAYDHLRILVSHDHHLADRACLLLAQIYIDLNHGEAALETLEQISEQPALDDSFLLLELQANILLQNNTSVIALDRNLRERLQFDKQKMRLSAMIAQYYFHAGEFKEAKRRLESSLAICADLKVELPLYRARLMTSLGACLIAMSRPDSARMHLEESERIQKHYGDQLGLIHTRKNRAMIDSI